MCAHRGDVLKGICRRGTVTSVSPGRLKWLRSRSSCFVLYDHGGFYPYLSPTDIVVQKPKAGVRLLINKAHGVPDS